MKGLKSWVALICAVCMACYPVLATAGSPARLLPSGKVTLINSQGERVITSPVPVPENTVMMCDGLCVVQGAGLQLVAKDKAVFAVTTANLTNWELFVKKGSVDFAMKQEDVTLKVRTPKDLFVLSPATVPASTDRAVVRGIVTVADDGKASLQVTSGELRVVSSSGEQILREGMELRLAQVELPGGAAGTTGGGFLSGLSTTQMVLLGVAGAAAAGGIGYGIYKAVESGGEESPF